MNCKRINLLSFIIFCFVLVFASETACYAQQDSLAIVNGKLITGNDFKNRFEMSVYPGKGLNENLYKTKRDFLYSMVAEQLLSDAARNNFHGTDKNEELLKDEAERMFLRDALYRKEVLSKAKVSKKELNQGLKFSTYTYIIDTFYFPDSSMALDFYNVVKNKSRNIYKVSDSLKIRHDTLGIGYGESNENIEDAFFGHEDGFISKPTNTVDGWVIFKILNRIINKKFTSLATNEKSEKIREIIKSRKENKFGYEYLMSVMKGVKVNVNYRIFRPLVYFIKGILATHRPFSYEPYYYLSQGEISEIKKKFSYDPKAPLLRFNGGDLTLGYVLDNLSTAGFAPKDTSLPEITVSLHSALKFIVQNYFLAKRAVQLGLENSQEVKYNVQMFLDAYLSARLTDEVLDTVKVTQTQVNNYFETHKDEVLKDVELRLQMFSFENINEAAQVLNKLSELKNSTEDTTGAIWLRASQLSELGAVLAELKNGDVYGPIFVKGKYTIFRVLDKRSSISSYKIQHSIQVAKDMLLSQTRRDVLSKYIAHLAEEQRVTIFANKLGSINVTPIQMLTFRYIGFGGKIVAVPTLYPHEDWIKYYNPKNVVP